MYNLRSYSVQSIMYLCKKEKREEGGHEILEDKGAEQETRGGRRPCLETGRQGGKISVETTVFLL